MKWIKSRKSFISESKIRELILPSQANAVITEWGEKFLDYEEIEPTNKIKQGTWKLSEDDKIEVLDQFFGCDIKRAYSRLNSLPDRFAEVLNNSIDLSLLKDERWVSILSGSNKGGKKFDIKNPTLDQIYLIYSSIFRRLSVAETKASEIISKDENGRPILDEGGNRIMIPKESGDPVYGKNLLNINSFLDDYQKCYPEDNIERVGFFSMVILSVLKINHQKM